MIEMENPKEPWGLLVFKHIFSWLRPLHGTKIQIWLYSKYSLISLLLLFSFFSNVTGLAACLICPERFFCEGAEGDSKTPIPCPRGHYCPAGTGKSPEKCPAGTYNPQVRFINSLGDFLTFYHCLGVRMSIRDFVITCRIILILVSIAFYCCHPTLQC